MFTLGNDRRDNLHTLFKVVFPRAAINVDVVDEDSLQRALQFIDKFVGVVGEPSTVEFVSVTNNYLLARRKLGRDIVEEVELYFRYEDPELVLYYFF